MLDPIKVTVAVDPLKFVTGVRVRCYDASQPWYLAGVTMEGYFVGGGDGPFRKTDAQTEERLLSLEERLAKLERSFNFLWGRVFKEGYELSRFGSQVEEYACIYTSRVTNFVYYSPLHYFRAPLERMAHERGEIPSPDDDER
mgnify:CR=1 FL=1